MVEGLLVCLEKLGEPFELGPVASAKHHDIQTVDGDYVTLNHPGADGNLNMQSDRSSKPHENIRASWDYCFVDRYLRAPS